MREGFRSEFVCFSMLEKSVCIYFFYIENAKSNSDRINSILEVRSSLIILFALSFFLIFTLYLLVMEGYVDAFFDYYVDIQGDSKGFTYGYSF